jgi:hypothetical protein
LNVAALAGFLSMGLSLSRESERLAALVNGMKVGTKASFRARAFTQVRRWYLVMIFSAVSCSKYSWPYAGRDYHITARPERSRIRHTQHLLGRTLRRVLPINRLSPSAGPLLALTGSNFAPSIISNAVRKCHGRQPQIDR